MASVPLFKEKEFTMMDLREEFRNDRATPVPDFVESISKALFKHTRTYHREVCPDDESQFQLSVLISLIYVVEKLTKFDTDEIIQRYIAQIIEYTCCAPDRRNDSALHDEIMEEYNVFKNHIYETMEDDEIAPANYGFILAEAVSSLYKVAPLTDRLRLLCDEQVLSFLNHVRKRHQEFVDSTFPDIRIVIDLTSGIDIEAQIHGTILLKCVNHAIDYLHTTLKKHPEIQIADVKIEDFRREMLYTNLQLSRGPLHFQHEDEDLQVFLEKRRAFWMDFASFVTKFQYDGSETTKLMIFNEFCAVDPELIEAVLVQDTDYDKDVMRVDCELYKKATLYIREKLGARLFDPIQTEFAHSFLKVRYGRVVDNNQ